MAFKSQGEAVRAAFALVTGSAYSGPTKLLPDIRTKIAEVLLGWFNEGQWTIKSDRCNKGDGLIAYIGGDAKKAMKCNIIDNFLTRDKSTEVKAEKAGANSKLDIIKAALEAGLISQEQALEAVSKLIS